MVSEKIGDLLPLAVKQRRFVIDHMERAVRHQGWVTNFGLMHITHTCTISIKYAYVYRKHN